MIWNMKKSGYIYTYPDNYAKICHKVFAAKKKVNYTTNNNKTKAASWVFNRALQAMWKTELQVCQRERTRATLLSCHQCIWQKPYYGLCATNAQETGRGEFRQLSKTAKSYRKNMRYQSQTFSQEGTFLKSRSWFLEWYRPP